MKSSTIYINRLADLVFTVLNISYFFHTIYWACCEIFCRKLLAFRVLNKLQNPQTMLCMRFWTGFCVLPVDMAYWNNLHIRVLCGSSDSSYNFSIEGGEIALDHSCHSVTFECTGVNFLNSFCLEDVMVLYCH